MNGQIYAPDYLRSKDDKQLHSIADMIEHQAEKLQRLQLEKEFVIAYLNPVDTSFRTMIDAFRSLTKDQQEKLLKLSAALKDVAETKDQP